MQLQQTLMGGPSIYLTTKPHTENNQKVIAMIKSFEYYSYIAV